MLIVFDIFVFILETAFFFAGIYFRLSSGSSFIYLKGRNEYFDIIKPGKKGFVSRPVTRTDIIKALNGADDEELRMILKKRLKEKNYLLFCILLFFVIPFFYLWIKALLGLI